MANSRGVASFTNSFIQGFSFVDQINARKRQDVRLEERLAEEREFRNFQRGRLEQSDIEHGEDRAEDKLTREEDRALKQRTRQARLIFSKGVDATDEELAEFADIDFIAEMRNQRARDRQTQTDFELIHGDVFSGPGEGADPIVNPDPAAQVPVAEPAGPTLDPLQAPVEEPEGIEQKAARIRQLHGGGGAGTLPNAGAAGFPEDLVGKTPREIENERREFERGSVNAQWETFSDPNNQSGNALRELNPNILVAKYFDDRGNLDTKTRNAADKAMREPLNATIAAQTIIHTDAPPGSREQRNAQRKLSEAYSLGNEIGFSFSPSDAAGVDDRGMPVGGNEVLSQSVFEQAQAGPGSPLPASPSSQRADATLINRPVRGKRISKRKLDAAYRQWKGGHIDTAQYAFYRNQGRLPTPPGEKPEITKLGPKDSLYATWIPTDGGPAKSQLLVPAREGGIDSRNPVEGDALKHLTEIAKALNTTDDPSRGFRIQTEFLGILGENEQKAILAGYDYSNLTDVALLWQRFVNLGVVRDAVNDEWRFMGSITATFHSKYGSLADALFNRSLDDKEKFDREELSSTLTSIHRGIFGLGDPAPPLQPLKARPQATYDNIRRSAPGFANASNEEIEEALQAQDL